MTFLPIVARELRVATRRKGTYWCRYVAAVGAVIVCCVLLGEAQVWKRSSQIGNEIFYDISLAALIYSLFAGVFATADCLSSEKRNGTLGLLFLTDLKGYDVVLGKLASTSLTYLYGLLAVFPVMAITLPLGGVTIGEYSRMALVLLTSLMFSLSMGMAVSAISRREKTVVVATILAILIFIVVPMLFYSMVWGFFGESFIGLCVLTCDPYFSFLWVRKLTRSAHYTLYFWWSLANLQLISLGLLWISCSLARTSWQDKAHSARAQRWRDRWRTWSHGDAELRRTYRRTLVDRHPMLWLGSRDRLQRPYVWLVLAVVVTMMFGVASRISNAWHDSAFIILASVILHSFLKIWLASEATRRFGDDVRNGSLELLLSTCLNWKEIVQGHLRSLRHQFLRACLAVVALDAFLLVAMASRTGIDSEVRATLCFGMIASAGMFLMDLHVLSWVGMLDGLRLTNSRRATTTALFNVLLVPWLIFGLLFIMAGGQIPLVLQITLMLTIKILYNIVVLDLARSRLAEYELQIREPTETITAYLPPSIGPKEKPTDWTSIKARVGSPKQPSLEG